MACCDLDEKINTTFINPLGATSEQAGGLLSLAYRLKQLLWLVVVRQPLSEFWMLSNPPVTTSDWCFVLSLLSGNILDFHKSILLFTVSEVGFTDTSVHRIVTVVSSDVRWDKYTTLLTGQNGTLGLVSVVGFPTYYPLRIFDAGS